MIDILDELKLLIRSRYGAIIVPSGDSKRLESIAHRLADTLSIPAFQWTRTRGLERSDEEQVLFGTQSLRGALEHIRASKFGAIYQMRISPEDLESQEIIALIEEVAKAFSTESGGVLFTGPSLTLPDALVGHVARITVPDPSQGEYKELLVALVRDLSKSQKIQVKMTQTQANRLLKNLRGFTLLEAEKVLTKAIIIDNALTEKDILRVIEAKTEIVEREGLLEYYPVDTNMTDIAGLEGLKKWLRKRSALLADPTRAAEFGLSFPKGLLLLGIPGTGKSLCAKAVAKEWTLPLLKMDPASLYNRYVGQTEENFRRAMKIAEKMSPVVLWIDEIEKAFNASGSDNDSGLSTRVLGTFLSWLQDRNGDVFVVATANDVSRLPPELLRKGRFDEIFFVDLPKTDVREELFSIHLRKRGQDPENFDLKTLAEPSDGFTGADIEQVIISGLYSAFAEKGDLTNQGLCKEVGATKCLVQIMPEKIASLRAWARGRTVSADE